MALISIVDGTNGLLYTPPSFMHKSVALFMVAGAGQTIVTNHRELSARAGVTTEPANDGTTTPLSLRMTAPAPAAAGLFSRERTLHA
jgi:hypothetical protein